ncbi:MAG: hypothetical protein P1U57_14775, partial [Oleibacter sp.]|nr:hypothetical protein [Thalassolituus sp.]
PTRTSLFGESVVNTEFLDNIVTTIEVLENNDVTIIGGPTGDSFAADFYLTSGAIGLQNADGEDTAKLINSFTAYGGFRSIEASIKRVDEVASTGATGDFILVNSTIRLGIEDLDLDASPLSLRLEDAVIAGPGYLQRDEKIANEAGDMVDVNSADEKRESYLATIYTDIYSQENDGNEVVVSLMTNEPGYNVFDIDMPKVFIGGSPIGSLSIDNLDLSNVMITISGRDDAPAPVTVTQ